MLNAPDYSRAFRLTAHEVVLLRADIDCVLTAVREHEHVEGLAKLRQALTASRKRYIWKVVTQPVVLTSKEKPMWRRVFECGYVEVRLLREVMVEAVKVLEAGHPDVGADLLEVDLEVSWRRFNAKRARANLH